MHPLVHHIAVPNPFFEGRNSVYLIRSAPMTLIDTGVATDKAYAHVLAGLEEVDVDVKDIRRVVLTHKHIDHIGNAWRIQQASGADVLIHENEIKSLADVDPSGKRFGDLVAKKLDAWGVPKADRKESTGTKMPQWKIENCDASTLPNSLHFDSDDVPNLEVIHTPGHTMGSVCLRWGDALFTGDHILEKISPNIGGGDMRSRGMLARFLNSLRAVEALGDLELLPGHGEPFRGLEERCARLTKHHEIRLKQAARAVERGSETVHEVALALYGKLKDFHIMLGCAEANAHLEFLADRGDIVQDGEHFRMP